MRLFFLTLFIAIAPLVAHAADLQDVLKEIGNLVAIATPIIAALALLFFFWGLAIFILNAGNESKKTEGRGIMIWGIIALFVMVSIWGLVEVLQSTFQVTQTNTPDLPLIPTQ